MKKNSDKSHSSIGMFPHRFGRFLPSVTHLASEKLILPNFSMLRGVAVSVCFPEVRNRKQTESGLPTTECVASHSMKLYGTENEENVGFNELVSSFAVVRKK